MRVLGITARTFTLLFLAAVSVPSFASFVYVPVSPTVVAQTEDHYRLMGKVSEAPFGNFRTDAHPGGPGCGGSEPPLTCSPYTFTGHLYDQESGLYYFGARYYDPETGRFLSQDPVAGDALNPPSLHKYLYAYSSPMNYTDPWGEYALNDDQEAFTPNVRDPYDVGRMKMLSDQATREGGSFTSLRGRFEKLLADSGDKKARYWNTQQRYQLYALYMEMFGYDSAQNNKGYIFTEKAPESLRSNWKTVAKDAATTWDLSAEERAESFGGAAWGAVRPVAKFAAEFAQDPHKAVFESLLESAQLGAHIGTVGWTEFSQETWAATKKPFEEGDYFEASATFGEASGVIYMAGRPVVKGLFSAEKAPALAPKAPALVLQEGQYPGGYTDLAQQPRVSVQVPDEWSRPYARQSLGAAKAEPLSAKQFESSAPRLPPKGTPERAAIERARKEGIKLKTLEELADIRSGGQGAGVWSEAELQNIRETGRFPSDVRWHHDPTVANRPDLATQPWVVHPVRGGVPGHLEAHGGDWRLPR